MHSVGTRVSILLLTASTLGAASAQSTADEGWLVPAGGIAPAHPSAPLPTPGPIHMTGRVIGFPPPSGEPKARVATFPTFKATVTIGRSKYPFTMVGSSPFLKRAKPVVVSVPIIPVVLHFADGTVMDPTAAAGGCAGSKSALDLSLESPLFQNVDYGEGVGRQFVEEVRRMEFWAYTGPGRLNPNYSVRLVPKVLPTLELTVSSDVGATEAAPCGRIAGLQGPPFDAYLRGVIFPQLPRFGVSATAFPVFLLLNTVTVFPEGFLGGYHWSTAVGGQTYGVAMFDSSGSGDPDVAVLSHEIAEWYDDPYGNNPTPPWGHIGQVTGCQRNLEVGDPLTGVLWPPVEMNNGFAYHLQETAFFSWFYRQVPSIGLAGWYSSFGTLLSPSEPCQ